MTEPALRTEDSPAQNGANDSDLPSAPQLLDRLWGQFLDNLHQKDVRRDQH